ncbi:MAG: hypothetical protein EA400_13300 [Chromatiaceae bacterium]|nr:MAG: hypothetical protein EA400_13300 [Chromatiaceae bacterium]
MLAGVGLSLVAALVPHRAHAFELLPLQAAAGLVPYALFAMLAWMLREPIVKRLGLVTLTVHLLALLIQRGLASAQADTPMLVAVPLFMAIILLVLWPRALRASAPVEVAGNRAAEQAKDRASIN